MPTHKTMPIAHVLTVPYQGPVSSIEIAAVHKDGCDVPAGTLVRPDVWEVSVQGVTGVGVFGCDESYRGLTCTHDLNGETWQTFDSPTGQPP